MRYKKANQIYLWAVDKLEKELNKQILEDGGHYERTFTYHVLLLDRLVEVACVVENILDIRPHWLVEKIKLMKNWVEIIYEESKTFTL